MNSRDYQPGEQVPGTVYRVVRLIGGGGMGTVYDVEDVTIGKRYVLKTLHPQLGAREDLARRMQNEARTLARLNHPNIVEVITAGVTADDLRLPYYVMQRLNGQSLRLVLEKKGRLELTHAYHITIDLLDALDHAHDKGVIHRDVKPDNIFLHRTSAGVTVTKLLDFGIVSVLDSGSHETAGRFVGTLRYAAPEQLRGDKPTPKTDVYAAGLVLYEIIAGRGPFDDEGDPQSIGTAHMKKLPLPVSQFAPVPRELDALLAAALAKDPNGRPRDAFSFAASLRNLKRNHHPASPAEGMDVISTPLPSLAPSKLPSATARGVVAPTVGQPVVAPASERTASRALEAIDRMTPTRSIAIDTRRVPQHGTEALSVAPSQRSSSIPAGEGSPSQREWSGPPSSSLRWPVERGPERSEAPQVRSLHAPVPSRASAAAWIGGVLGTCALVGAAAGAWVVGQRSATDAPGSVGAAGLSGPPLATPVWAAPAPTLELPAFDEPSVSDARAKAVRASDAGTKP